MELKFKAIHPKIGREIPLPQFATPGSAAMDLRACLDGPVTLQAGARAVIPTGLAMALPSADYVALVFARSGLGIKKGVCLSNGVGVIDSDYRGEIAVGLVNLSGEDYTVQPGDRIAQLMVVPVVQPTVTLADELDETDRGSGGLGSTGREWDMAKIVLASGSPRRQELLRRMGITEFDIRVPEVEEYYPDHLSPEEIVKFISREKSDAAARLCGDDELVITADTMVFLDERRLGKPRDEAQALEMLTALAGRKHTVCTGVTVRRGAKICTAAQHTDVYFRPATERELRAYIRTGEPMDKAGAYGVQGKGALLVERIDGDFFNVMGLPVGLLARLLKGFGIDLME